MKITHRLLLTALLVGTAATLTAPPALASASAQQSTMALPGERAGWYQADRHWYYLDENGDALTGWVKDGTRWYYFNSSGEMQLGWLKDGAQWYYLAADGAMQTGWLRDGAQWYYLAADGAMQTGWLRDGNAWYYLSASGAMLANTTTPDGYQLGADGAWIQQQQPQKAAAAATGTNTAGSGVTIDQVDADFAIEADVQVTGVNGSVAKLVILTPAAACSIDIVDNDRCYFYRENIFHNAAGGQDYRIIGDTPSGQPRHLMLTFNSATGEGKIYVDGREVDSFTNPNMKAASVFGLSVEAGAKVNGSSVNAVFTNIRLKKYGVIRNKMTTRVEDNNPGLHSDDSAYASEGRITISGTEQLGAGEDWDTAYNSSSGKIEFY